MNQPKQLGRLREQGWPWKTLSSEQEVPTKVLPLLLVPWTTRKKAPRGGDALLAPSLHPGDWHCLTYQQIISWGEEKKVPDGGKGHQHGQTALPTGLDYPKTSMPSLRGGRSSHNTREGDPGVKKTFI